MQKREGLKDHPNKIVYHEYLKLESIFQNSFKWVYFCG